MSRAGPVTRSSPLESNGPIFQPSDRPALSNRLRRHRPQRQREVRFLAWLESVWNDARYGWRGLRRAPGFAIVAVVTIALGIGATTAIFSVVSAVLLRPLPYAAAERLVHIGERKLDRPGRGGTTSLENYND